MTSFNRSDAEQICNWASKVAIQAEEYASIVPKELGYVTENLDNIVNLALQIHYGLATMECGAFDENGRFVG